MQAFTTSEAGFTVLMPIIRPMPLTLSTPGAPCRASKAMALFFFTSARSFSSIRFRMLSAPAQQTGFPPKVEPWSPAPRVNSVFSP